MATIDSAINLCYCCDLFSFCGEWGEGAGESDKGKHRFFHRFFTNFSQIESSQIRNPMQAQVQIVHTCQAQKTHLNHRNNSDIGPSDYHNSRL